MARKTASIVNLIERTNLQLSRELPHTWSKEQQQGFRWGVAAALEATLFENDVYAGFSYLESVGVKRNADGTAARPWSCEDESRRSYLFTTNC